ncbi:hypothetical protein IIK98_004357 [Salmonella enterica subsp. enterica serovar Stanley]|nr:hypothetical protein [Salmonella enterica subsp. enterica serovar Stanley]
MKERGITDGLTMNQLAERNAEHVTTIAALESRCASLSAKLSMINDLMEVAEQANKLAQEAAEKLVQERNTLAAENAALKKSEVEFNEYCRHECEDVGDTWVDDFTETPATDAFLAEVRAQGVEMFSEKFGGGTLLSNMVKEVAADFAAKLRKGVAQ